MQHLGPAPSVLHDPASAEPRGALGQSGNFLAAIRYPRPSQAPSSCPTSPSPVSLA